MRVQIISSTDNKYLGKIIYDRFPVMLDDDTIFEPDGEPIKIGASITRYYNSNYSIDVQPVI
jgi:hypothetical protein